MDRLLALVQGYIYVLLGLEDYALLAGTVGLISPRASGSGRGP